MRTSVLRFGWSGAAGFTAREQIPWEEFASSTSQIGSVGGTGGSRLARDTRDQKLCVITALVVKLLMYRYLG